MAQVDPIPGDLDPAIQSGVSEVSQAVPGLVSDVQQKNVVGGLQDAEKVYQQVSPLVPTIVSEAKAGYKTTEFYLVIAYEALTQTGAIHLPGTWGKAAAGIAGIVAYVLSRGLAKSGVPNQEPVE